MSPEKAKKNARKYHLELTFTTLFFWSLGFFLVLGWIFVLGVLVGRGFLSDEIKNFSELKSNITRLQEMITDKKESELEEIKKLGKDSKYAFYDELSKKENEPTLKNIPEVKKEPEKKVEIKISPAVPKKETAKKPPAKKEGAQATEPRYTVQIASLDNEFGAIRLVNQWLARGHAAFYTKAKVKGRTYFRVKCGRFVSLKEAQTFNQMLTNKEKVHGFVTNINR